MNRPSIRLLASLLPILLAARVAATEGVQDATAVPAQTAREAAPTAVAPRLPSHLMSPMVAEMFVALDEQRERITKLRAELAQARGGPRAFELQRALSSAKQETELRLLRIQASHARREGRLEAAGNIEAAIAAMGSPPTSREPLARPAPSRDPGR